MGSNCRARGGKLDHSQRFALIRLGCAKGLIFSIGHQGGHETKGVCSPRIIIFSLILGLLLAWACDASASLPQKRVLVLYSEDKDHPAHGLTDQGIREVFRSNQLFDVQLFTEYLDVSRFGSRSHARAMADFLRRKYSGMEIHAIIAVYPYAVDFLLAERDTLFPEVPIIVAETSRGHSAIKRLGTK